MITPLVLASREDDNIARQKFTAEDRSKIAFSLCLSVFVAIKNRCTLRSY